MVPLHESSRNVVVSNTSETQNSSRRPSSEARTGPNSVVRPSNNFQWQHQAQSEADSALQRGNALSLQASQV